MGHQVYIPKSKQTHYLVLVSKKTSKAHAGRAKSTFAVTELKSYRQELEQDSTVEESQYHTLCIQTAWTQVCRENGQCSCCQEGTILIPPTAKLKTWQQPVHQYTNTAFIQSLFSWSVERSNAAVIYWIWFRKVRSPWKQRFGFPFCLAVKGRKKDYWLSVWMQMKTNSKAAFVTIGFRKQYAVPGPSVDILTWCSKSSQL